MSGIAVGKWTIEQRSDLGDVTVTSACACGGRLTAFVSALALFATAKCSKCRRKRDVPFGVFDKAQKMRSDALDEAAKFRLRHGGSGLWIPE